MFVVFAENIYHLRSFNFLIHADIDTFSNSWFSINKHLISKDDANSEFSETPVNKTL